MAFQFIVKLVCNLVRFTLTLDFCLNVKSFASSSCGELEYLHVVPRYVKVR